MMKKSLALALFGLFALVALAPLAAPPAARAEVGTQKEIRVAPVETQDKIFSLGGHVLIEGAVREDVFVIGGSITISGEAGQSVVGIGSHIVVKTTAKIGEDLAALGGTLEKEPACAIGGDTIYFQTRELGDKLFNDGVFQGVFSLSLIPIIVVIKLVIILAHRRRHRRGRPQGRRRRRPRWSCRPQLESSRGGRRRHCLERIEHRRARLSTGFGE